MNEIQMVTFKMPSALKRRLDQAAKHNAVPTDQLVSYLLTVQLDCLETLSSPNPSFSQKSLPELKAKVRLILDKVPDRDVPDWDLME